MYVCMCLQPQKQQIFDSSGAENVNGDGLFLCQMKENLDPGTSSLSEGRIGIYNKEVLYIRTYMHTYTVFS